MKNISKLISFLFMIFFISTSIMAFANSVHSVQALQILLKSNFKIKADDIRKSISYCPNETCEVIQAPTEVSYEELGDFFYLYLYYFSAYDDLEKSSTEAEPFRKAGTKFIKEITERNTGECKGNIDNELAACILLAMSSKNNIQIYSSRLEKGLENLTPINIKEIVHVDNNK